MRTTLWATLETTPWTSSVVVDGRRVLRHLHEELDVRAGLAQLGQQQVDGLLVVQRVQHPTQLHGDRELVRRKQQLLLAGAGLVDIDGRERPLVGDLAVQLQLGVAGALELLEDHRVTRGPGLHQRGGEDGQRAAVLDVACRAEEPLGREQRGRVDTTGEDPAGRGRSRVIESSSTTTSWPISTRRLARSMDSSATVVWSPGGRSKVEAMTSPFTDRCMSVTSSGRSSTSTTMR